MYCNRTRKIDSLMGCFNKIAFLKYFSLYHLLAVAIKTKHIRQELEKDRDRYSSINNAQEKNTMQINAKNAHRFSLTPCIRLSKLL